MIWDAEIGPGLSVFHLGLIIDRNVNFIYHIVKVYRKLSSSVFNLRRLS